MPFSTDAPSDILIMDTEANKYTLNIYFVVEKVFSVEIVLILFLFISEVS